MLTVTQAKMFWGVGVVSKAPNLSSGQTADPPSAVCTHRPFKPAQMKIKAPSDAVCVWGWGAGTVAFEPD